MFIRQHKFQKGCAGRILFEPQNIPAFDIEPLPPEQFESSHRLVERCHHPFSLLVADSRVLQNALPLFWKIRIPVLRA
jgi:hypothetical protein